MHARRPTVAAFFSSFFCFFLLTRWTAWHLANVMPIHPSVHLASHPFPAEWNRARDRLYAMPCHAMPFHAILPLLQPTGLKYFARQKRYCNVGGSEKRQWLFTPFYLQAMFQINPIWRSDITILNSFGSYSHSDEPTAIRGGCEWANEWMISYIEITMGQIGVGEGGGWKIQRK